MAPSRAGTRLGRTHTFPATPGQPRSLALPTRRTATGPLRTRLRAARAVPAGAPQHAHAATEKEPGGGGSKAEHRQTSAHLDAPGHAKEVVEAAEQVGHAADALHLVGAVEHLAPRGLRRRARRLQAPLHALGATQRLLRLLLLLLLARAPARARRPAAAAAALGAGAEAHALCLREREARRRPGMTHRFLTCMRRGMLCCMTAEQSAARGLGREKGGGGRKGNALTCRSFA